MMNPNDDIKSIEQALIEADLQWENLQKMNMPIHNLRFWQVYYVKQFFLQQMSFMIHNPDQAMAYLKVLENLNKDK